MAEAAELIGALFEALRPEERLLVSDWADRYRVLAQQDSAEPGEWRTDRIPYAREIMNSLSSDDPTREVVWMKASQIGATQCANNWVGYVIDHCPAPMLLVMPNDDMAKRNSRTRIAPMITAAPRLEARIAPARSRESGNTQLYKEFTGGFILMTGARSASNLRSTPIRFVYFDEEDGYPDSAEDEGSPIELGRARTRNFSRKKIFRTSTPTITGRSSIEVAYESGTQERYHVPCPHCGEMDWIRWPNIQWRKTDDGEHDTEKAYLVCEANGCVIEEHHKTWMLANGQWIARKPGRQIRSFHLSALYSPLGWYSWGEAAADFVAAQGDTNKLRTFTNTVLGESFYERGDAPDHEELYRRREPYSPGTVPLGGAVLTAAVDVQADRLECEVVAWGRRLESWSVEVVVLDGDPSGDKVWHELDEVRGRVYPTEAGGHLPIRLTVVDSGYLSQEVYTYARRNNENVRAVKGSEAQQVVVGQPKPVDINRAGKRIARGTKIWPVGVSVVKRELYGWLRQKPPKDPGEGYPRGWCHFPEYDEEYFRQLCAEQLVARADRRGYTKLEWEKTRARNEALDLRVYGRAATYMLGLDRWSDDQWEAAESEAATAQDENGKNGKQRASDKLFKGGTIGGSTR